VASREQQLQNSQFSGAKNCEPISLYNIRGPGAIEEEAHH